MARTDEETLELYETAEESILATGQGVGIGGRSLTRADLKFVATRIETLKARIAARSRGPIRAGLPRVSA